MPTAPRSSARSFFSRPPLPLLTNPLDALPAAINHLLAAEPWARAQLAPHVGKTLDVVVMPFTIRLSVAGDGTVVRAAAATVASTTVTIPYAALPRFLASGRDGAMRDLRIDGDAEFAQAVSTLAANLRWDVEEDLSKVVGDAASHRMVAAARAAHHQVRSTSDRMAAGLSEYLLEENPQLVRPRAVQGLADGIRGLRDDLERLEKRVDRLAPGVTGRR
jgi:ubiquinone biosynthesis accessory factor UbiJ